MKSRQAARTEAESAENLLTRAFVALIEPTAIAAWRLAGSAWLSWRRRLQKSIQEEAWELPGGVAPKEVQGTQHRRFCAPETWRRAVDSRALTGHSVAFPRRILRAVFCAS